MRSSDLRRPIFLSLSIKEHEYEIEPSHHHGSSTCKPFSFRSQPSRTGESADPHDPHPHNRNGQSRSRSRSGASILPNEVRETVKLYLDGKIDQWFSLQGRNGVAFILNVTDPTAAHDMLEKLPLGQAHLMSFELLPLAPLNPLRQLQGITPTPAPAN